MVGMKRTNVQYGPAGKRLLELARGALTDGYQWAIMDAMRAVDDELERRGIDEQLLGWLISEGATPFPQDCTYWEGYPGPAGFRPYFAKLYLDWPV